MKLTQEQIQKLYKFTRKRLVEHYDLQTELVDHLANGIEQQWEEYPERTFKDAQLREFRKFGSTGFKKVIKKRKSAMVKRYRKIVFRFFLEYFKLPKVIYIVLSTLILYLTIKNLGSWKYDIILVFFFAIVSVVFIVHFKKRKNNELEQVKYGKKWMLNDQIYSYAGFASALNMVPLILNYSFFRKVIPMDNSLVDFFIALLLITLVVLAYITAFVIPQKAEELLAETYPEYKMV